MAKKVIVTPDAPTDIPQSQSDDRAIQNTVRRQDRRARVQVGKDRLADRRRQNEAKVTQARQVKASSAVEAKIRSVADASKSSFSVLKARVRSSVNAAVKLAARVTRMESRLQSLTTQAIRASSARSSLVNTDLRHQASIDSTGACLSGNVVHHVDQDIDAHAIDITAATLNAAAAGTHLEAVSLGLSARYIIDGVTDNFVDHPLSFHPKLTVAEAVADVQVGDIAYYAGNRVPAATTGTWTWDGTTTVLTGDTSGVYIGDAIRLTSDGQWFEVIGLTEDVSVLLRNPHALSIPSAATGTDVGDLPRFIDGGMALVIVPDTDADVTKHFETTGDSWSLTVDVSSVPLLVGVTDMVITVSATA